jgi:hypothetical protein
MRYTSGGTKRKAPDAAPGIDRELGGPQEPDRAASCPLAKANESGEAVGLGQFDLRNRPKRQPVHDHGIRKIRFSKHLRKGVKL